MGLYDDLRSGDVIRTNKDDLGVVITDRSANNTLRIAWIKSGEVTFWRELTVNATGPFDQAASYTLLFNLCDIERSYQDARS